MTEKEECRSCGENKEIKEYCDLCESNKQLARKSRASSQICKICRRRFRWLGYQICRDCHKQRIPVNSNFSGASEFRTDLFSTLIQSTTISIGDNPIQQYGECTKCKKSFFRVSKLCSSIKSIMSATAGTVCLCSECTDSYKNSSKKIKVSELCLDCAYTH